MTVAMFSARYLQRVLILVGERETPLAKDIF
jgi:hypothetical protein